MALEDTLARLAPREVDGKLVQWDIDAGTDWVEVTGWFKLSADAYETPIKHRSSNTEDGIRQCVEFITDKAFYSGQQWTDHKRAVIMADPIPPVKRPRGRPRKAA
jgi:hypothetical protein